MKQKSALAWAAAVAVLNLVVVGCGAETPTTTTPAVTTPAPSVVTPTATTESAGPLDLTGQWRQLGAGKSDAWQEATITADSIKIDFVGDGGSTKHLYWAGNYIAPTEAGDTYTWTSVNDTKKTDRSILGSSAPTKVFNYKDGIISFEVSLAGETTTMQLERSVQSPTSTGTPLASALPSVKPVAEIKEFGFGQARDYVWATALVHNVGHVGEFVTVHFNLLDAAGNLVASDNQVESFVNQEGLTAVGTQISVPAGTKIVSIKPTLSVSEYGTSDTPKPAIAPVPVTLEGEEASFVLTNDSDGNWEGVRVGIVCRDASGSVTGGGSAFPQLVPAGSQSVERVSFLIKSDSTKQCTAYPNLSN